MGKSGIVWHKLLFGSETLPTYTPVRRPVEIHTERLVLREMTKSHLPALCKILQDAETMCFYGGAFTYQECKSWLRRQQKRYQKHGFGLWAVTLKHSGVMIGQCGITFQHYGDVIVPEIGYLFNRNYLHKGYATEAAIACKHFAFTELGFSEIYSIISVDNFKSQRVAERNGMTCKDSFTKCYRGALLKLRLYSVSK